LAKIYMPGKGGLLGGIFGAFIGGFLGSLWELVRNKIYSVYYFQAPLQENIE